MAEKIKRFREEFRKTTGTAIIAALGFIIALAWNGVVTEYFSTLTNISPVGGKLISALIITFFAVIAIMIITRFMEKK